MLLYLLHASVLPWGQARLCQEATDVWHNLAPGNTEENIRYVVNKVEDNRARMESLLFMRVQCHHLWYGFWKSIYLPVHHISIKYPCDTDWVILNKILAGGLALNPWNAIAEVLSAFNCNQNQWKTQNIIYIYIYKILYVYIFVCNSV